ncbi:putative 37s ribosomal protein s18 protein [Eutypa lata UCREL1]|uniref:Small ribosomal subunit protein bS18m n=1 Tax=Eutypa lata (strain UCR-EL1) TaxID=1287681 RepID=M7SCA8_EUTLA|nr:putative 37s ribosomal protein s18 protein [Eutypa lata UCREL1]
MTARARNPLQRGPRGSGSGSDRDGGGAQRPRLVDEDLRTKWSQDDFARQMTRRWRPGDVYAPHDLSPSEMGKWRRNRARQQDLVDILGLKPLDMYRNFSVISEYMTTHGRIKRAVDTGLRPVNQRKMAKAIRRAIGLGLHPSVHHHPEILARDPVRRAVQNQPTVYNHKI